MVKKKRRVAINWKIVGVVFLVLVILVGTWFFFFSFKNCNDWECFNKNLKSCEKTKFNGGTKMIFEYTIFGKDNGECIVNVKLLQGELNNQDSIKLEGKEMKCSLPLGVVVLPESDIENCHGLLKESLQDLMIEKLHAYLVQNVGRINLEVLDVPPIG